MPKSKRATKKNVKSGEVMASKDVTETEETVVTEEVETTIAEETENTEPAETKEEEIIVENVTENASIKTSVYLQYAGNEYDEAALIENIKNIWAGDDHDISEISSIEVYIKPEEFCAYYVINGTDQGSVAL